MSDFLHTEIKDHVLTIRIDHPKANALNTEIVTALLKVFRQAGRDEAIRVVVLTGTGHIFSAGQDLGEFQQAMAMDTPVSYRQHLQKTYSPLVLAIRRIEKPVIAAINGTVAGAALGVALACDLRIAADTARFVVGFLGIGLAPDSAVSLFLPQIIGLGRASEFAFSNRPITAEQAFAWGLVNRLVAPPALERAVQEWAAELARGPIRAMGLAKRTFNRAVLPHLEDVLDYEGHIQEIAGHAAEHYEGVRAFFEKRPPNFLTP
ncbi:MAG: 2-(1,2-epoxy-1,2-dihydrophenyl)acetyl-CoA isomerase [Anaerolineae bacterium]|nr:MAG: 2-(1,2-epoxy-1,2-dihydrophenyl)acetyl-CoA isomerase [Anaerolineae bacterium]